MIATPLSVREAVDPKGTLPQVELKANADVKDEFEIRHQGEKIGSVIMQTNSENETYFQRPQLEGSYLGKGFGTAAYLTAIESVHARGGTFRTHRLTQSEDAVRVWRRFIDAGVAEVVLPFREVTSKNMDPEAYTGYVRIPPRVPLDAYIDRDGVLATNY